MPNEENIDQSLIEQEERSEVLVEEPNQALNPREALIQAITGGGHKKYIRFTMAALGAIPWVGSLLGAAASLSGENDQDNVNKLLGLWVEEHEVKIQNLSSTLKEIFSRFDNFGDDIQERINSEEYLALVRRTFRSWDQTETEEKRQMYKRLLISAGATSLSSDDLVRLFISWIDNYHEAHFIVIREVFNHSPITRGEIWDNIHPEGRPREDSSLADLFRYLIRELNTGGVIRQERQVTGSGQFMRAQRSPTRRPAPTTMETAFEDSKPYILSELGKEFVHYVMQDVAVQIESPQG